MKFSINDFFSKCDQIRSFLRIWLHLLKKSLMENFIFCAVALPYRIQSTDLHYKSVENIGLKWFNSFSVNLCKSRMASEICEHKVLVWKKSELRVDLRT